MTDTTKNVETPKLHPMESAIISFINEALCLEEAKARVSLIMGAASHMKSEIEKAEQAQAEPEIVDEGNPA